MLIYKTILLIMMIFIFWIVFRPVSTCRILVLSGGGAHGSFQAGVIKKLHETDHRWDIITGISAGSLNGIILAIYSSDDQQYAVETMELIWNFITQKDVYTKNWGPLLDQSMFDNTPLNHTIYKYVGELGGKIKRDIVIGAVEMNTGKMELFYNYNMTTLDDIVNIVMSSASTPIVFPPRLYNDKYYVDGGLFSNELILPGIYYCLEKNMTNITLDIISCDDPVEIISSKEISTYRLYDIIYRNYVIGSETLLNHAMYSDCNKRNYEYKIPMYLYRPTKSMPGGWLDFDHTVMVDAFDIGYKTKATKMDYCY